MSNVILIVKAYERWRAEGGNNKLDTMEIGLIHDFANFCNTAGMFADKLPDQKPKDKPCPIHYGSGK